MVKKVRTEKVTMCTYLNDIKDGDISRDQDVQRQFCSDNSFINGLGVTILTGDYLPPIILGEVIQKDCGAIQQYVIDGNQRTTALSMIRYANYRFTSSIEDSIIPYQDKKRDKNGMIIIDSEGNIEWEIKEFDIKNKTYKDFPTPLQKIFDSYQVETVIHQDCDMKDLSKLVRRYNNHRSMNTSQKSLTYLDTFARKAKTISVERFFKDSIDYSENQSNKGLYERIVCESVMSVFHLDNWKSSPKQMSIFLNEHSSMEEFDVISGYANRLENVCSDKYQKVFVPKDIAVWFAAFDKFTKYGLEDKCFTEFMDKFTNEMTDMEIDGETWNNCTKKRNTKDKKTMNVKIHILSKCIEDYFGISKNNTTIGKNEMIDCEKKEKKSVVDTELKHNVVVENKENTSEKSCTNTDKDKIYSGKREEKDILSFLRECVDENISEDDVKDYMEDLEILTLDVNNKSRLLNYENRKSLLGIVAYSYKKDIQIDEWFIDYFDRMNCYDSDQKKNYLNMRNSFITYQKKHNVA